jgi:RNA polymerase sigma factor (sigma-70 family)
MVRRSPIPDSRFDEILSWLNPDREAAASIYLKLYHDLTKIFAWNRCNDPEGLTDEVIDRAARKLHEVLPTYEGDPRLYFYGIARNIIREASKNAVTHVPIEDIVIPTPPDVNREAEADNVREECLQSCLQKLDAEKRELILAYYAKDKQAKIDHRSKLAERLSLSGNTLRVKAHRIRTALEDCIEACLEQMLKK